MCVYVNNREEIIHEFERDWEHRKSCNGKREE